MERLFFDRQFQLLQRPADGRRADAQPLVALQLLAEFRQPGIRPPLQDLTQIAPRLAIEQWRRPSAVRPGRNAQSRIPAPQQLLHERAADPKQFGHLLARLRPLLTRTHNAQPQVQRVRIHAAPPVPILSAFPVYSNLKTALGCGTEPKMKVSDAMPLTMKPKRAKARKRITAAKAGTGAKSARKPTSVPAAGGASHSRQRSVRWISGLRRTSNRCYETARANTRAITGRDEL